MSYKNSRFLLCATISELTGSWMKPANFSDLMPELVNLNLSEAWIIFSDYLDDPCINPQSGELLSKMLTRVWTARGEEVVNKKLENLSLEILRLGLVLPLISSGILRVPVLALHAFPWCHDTIVWTCFVNWITLYISRYCVLVKILLACRRE